MSQHDMVIADQSHTNLRADVNSALQALVSLNSGATEPTTKYAYMLWPDTTSGLLKIRNVANDAWITVATLAAFHASAAEVLAGALATKIVNPSVMNAELVKNLKPVVDGDVNKLDIFTKSGGAVPDASNIISVAIPDGNGYTFRSRAAAYLSGTSQFIMADAANYWSKGSLDAEIKNAYIYAIWDGTGIVWALAGYSGFNMVPTTTTITDDDYFLLEASSTYTRNNAHYCVCVGKIRYQYDTADTPDHTIQATVENGPQVIWNPKSDYGYQKNLATTVTQGSDIADYSAINLVVKQSGKYIINLQGLGDSTGGAPATINTYIKTGSATYGSAVQKAMARHSDYTNATPIPASCSAVVLLNAGDTIHGGFYVTGTSGNRSLYGDDTYVGITALNFYRLD